MYRIGYILRYTSWVEGRLPKDSTTRLSGRSVADEDRRQGVPESRWSGGIPMWPGIDHDYYDLLWFIDVVDDI